MSGMTTGNVDLLTRAEVWSAELKDVLEEDLQMTGYVDFLNEFPDGDTFKIPSIGSAQVDDYEEESSVEYRPIDTGQFTFSIDEYLSSGTYITRKAEQDMFYMNQLVTSFVPKQRRAIMEHFESTVLEKPEGVLGANANNQYTINNTFHRMSGGNSGVIEAADFAYALYALKQANVPQMNMVAIVHPSVEFVINTLSNLVNVSDNPRWEGIVADGIATGMRFVKNIYGFDVYTSNFLPDDVDDNNLPERDGSTTNDFSSNNGVANYFFSAAPDLLPWKAAWRQPPMVDQEWNKDLQRTEFVTTARYGSALFRPENMVSIITDPSVS